MLDAKFECTEDFVRILNEATDMVGSRFLNPFYHSDIIYLCSALSRKAKVAHEAARIALDRIFGQGFKRTCEDIDDDVDILNNNTRTRRRYFIDELCKIKKFDKSLTNEEIEENIKTIIIAVRH